MMMMIMIIIKIIIILYENNWYPSHLSFLPSIHIFVVFLF